MDISEFLASMQANPTDRALQRSTQMGIPDADNDPRTQDATAQDVQQDDDAGAPNSGQGGFDTDQMGGDAQEFEDGGDVEPRYGSIEGLPESTNIEDRRGEPPKVAPGEEANRSRGKLLPSQTWTDTGRRLKNKVLDLAQMTKDSVSDARASLGFDGGGDVPDDTSGAIPEPDTPEQPAAAAPPEEGDDSGYAGDSWRNSAHEAVTAGLDYNREAHGVNRPVTDETHERDVKDYLTGKGAVNPDQFAAAQRAVDPDGSLPPGSRTLKAIGSLFDFYNKKGASGGGGGEGDLPEEPYKDGPSNPGSEAAGAAIKLVSKMFNAFAMHATVAADKGADTIAAQSAQNALDKLPDGLSANVTFLGGAAGAAVREGAPPSVPGHVNIGSTAFEQPSPQDGGGKFKVQLTDDETGKPVLSKELTGPQLIHALQQGPDRMLEHGAPAIIAAAAKVAPGQEAHPKRPWYEQGYRPGSVIPGSNQLAGAQAPAGPYATPLAQAQLKAWQRANPGAQPPDPQSPAGKLIAAGKSPLASPGYPNSDQQWRSQQSGGVNLQGPRGVGPADPGTRPGNNPGANGLPPGVNTDMMSVGEASRLRRMANEGEIKGNPQLDVQRERTRGQIEAAKTTAGARTENNQRTNDTKLMTERERQTGLNGRQINSPSQQAQNDRAIINRAAAAADAEIKNGSKVDRQKLIDEYTTFFRSRMQATQGQQPQAPQQQPQPQAPQQGPQPGMEKNGYRFKGGNPADRNNWEPIGG